MSINLELHQRKYILLEAIKNSGLKLILFDLLSSIFLVSFFKENILKEKLFVLKVCIFVFKYLQICCDLFLLKLKGKKKKRKKQQHGKHI